jgi:hypothetical protein
MSNSQTVDRNRSHRVQAGKLLWPTAVAAFLFHQEGATGAGSFVIDGDLWISYTPTH